MQLMPLGRVTHEGLRLKCKGTGKESILQNFGSNFTTSNATGMLPCKDQHMLDQQVLDT